MGVLGDIARGGRRISREARDEGLAERVEIVRIAVMAQVPDRQDVVAPLRLEERVDIGEVVSSAALVDERPGNALARHTDAERMQHPVILVGVALVLGLLAQVATPTLVPQESRAFEARQEEGGEDALAAAHVKAFATRSLTCGSGMIR